MRIICFGSSNDSQSMSKDLVNYVSCFTQAENVVVLDINQYQLPLHSESLERAEGIPEDAYSFYNKVGTAEAYIIGLEEQNGSYSAAFKNLIDWCSRIDTNVFGGKPMVLVSTALGSHGGQRVLEQGASMMTSLSARVVGAQAFPSYLEHRISGGYSTDYHKMAKEVVCDLL